LGKVVVTGAGHGIGAALAARFAAAGEAVALLDRDVEAAEAGAGRIREAGGDALALDCDVTSAPACREAIEKVVRAWGGIDVLVNNAGVTHVGRVCETDVAVLRRVMDVNFFGAVHCTRAALPSLLERKGVVAVLSSVAGFAPLALRAGYVASKHAVQGFFETLRAEHRRDGLAVTLVCPSFVETGIGARALGTDAGAAGAAERTGVARAVSPQDAAERIVSGIRRRREIVWVGREARASWWLAQLAPRVYERLMVRRTLPGA
jgi:short-subunit dehydrogenase